MPMTDRSGTSFGPVRQAHQWLALLAFFALAVLLAVLAPSAATSAGEQPIQTAKLKQAGKSLIFQVRTSHEINMGRLARRPDFQKADQRYLCLEMNRRGRHTISRICLGGRTRTYQVLGVSRTTEAGRVMSSKVIRAEVKKVDGLKLVATFDPRDADLPSGPYAWRVADRVAGCRPEKTPGKDECLSQYPPKHRAVYDLRPIQTVGCTGGDGEVVRSGPSGRKRVALTFDDGPSDYTPEVLHILHKRHAKATFFMLGQQVASYPSYARRVLASGNEIGNHSYDHALLPSGSNIAHASREIERKTGFTPCLFRPPYGAINSGLAGAVKDNGMKSIIWDVDTNDWKLPGSAAIKSRVIGGSHSGSIVLMHDGGGPRSGTVDALDGIISGLRHRGYELVTVSELLGNRMIYRPAP